MDRENISSGSPYEPTIGFSRAVKIGRRVLVSGTAPVGAQFDSPEGASAFAQAERCFAIIVEALANAGAKPSDVVRTRMYLVDANDAGEVGRAHGEVFGAIRPAATMVVVKALLDPRWKVEIEAEAEL
jgi:enamine deaminase RidA (YjgF/YER057c/UK114 family)